jgi:hypothetical protein
MAVLKLVDLQSTFNVHQITSLEQVYWHLRPPSRQKKTQKKNKKKKQQSRCYPCFVDTNSDLLPPKPGRTTIKFFRSNNYAMANENVVPTQLVPFFVVAAGNPVDNKTAATTTFADHTAAYLDTLAEDEPDKFHPTKQCDHDRYNYQSPEFHRRVEQLLLQGVVDHFRQLATAQAVAAAQAEIAECSDDDDDDDDEPDDNEDEEQEQEDDMKPSSTSSPQATTTTATASSSAAATHQPPPKQVKRLRAGDYIRYWYGQICMAPVCCCGHGGSCFLTKMLRYSMFSSSSYLVPSTWSLVTTI